MFGKLIISLALFFVSSSLLADEIAPPPLQRPPHQIHAADPLLAKAWHLQNIHAFDAWKTSYGDPRVTVAVLDSGVNYNHPEIAPNIRWKMSEWPSNGQDKDGNGFIDDVIGWDFVKGSFLPFDRSGHGTAMSAIIAGVLDNGIGAAGVCPKCTLLPVRFIDAEGLGENSDAIAGIHYAIGEGVSVINVSFAGEGADDKLLAAIQDAGQKDIVVVVAAGNDGVNLDTASVYPAKYQESNMITVAATTPQDTLMEGSSWSDTYVGIGAPGEDIVQPWFDKWDTGSGTSQATAVVSGAVGLIRSIAPSLRANEVINLIKATARQIPAMNGQVQTGAILDLSAAVQCARHNYHPCLRH